MPSRITPGRYCSCRELEVEGRQLRVIGEVERIAWIERHRVRRGGQQRLARLEDRSERGIIELARARRSSKAMRLVGRHGEPRGKGAAAQNGIAQRHSNRARERHLGGVGFRGRARDVEAELLVLHQGVADAAASNVVQRRVGGDVVVVEGALVLELLAGKDQTHAQAGRWALLVVDLVQHARDRVGRIDFETQRLAGPSPNEDLHGLWREMRAAEEQNDNVDHRSNPSIHQIQYNSFYSSQQ